MTERAPPPLVIVSGLSGSGKSLALNTFEDLGYLNEILASGGFSNVNVSAYQGLQPIGGVNAVPHDAVSFVLSSMAVGRALDEQGDDIRAAAEIDLVDLFEQHYAAGQGVMMMGKAWLVSATA